MTDDREPDPRLVWRWAGDAIRPIVGWLLTALGAVALVVSYLGVSGELLVARQLPYVVSGGLGGIALVFLGGIYLGAQDVRRSTERNRRLEQQVDELHRVLLAHYHATEAREEPTDADQQVYALPTGTTYHRADCAVMAGKNAGPVGHATVEERQLSPCKLCAPAAD